MEDVTLSAEKDLGTVILQLTEGGQTGPLGPRAVPRVMREFNSAGGNVLTRHQRMVGGTALVRSSGTRSVALRAVLLLGSFLRLVGKSSFYCSVFMNASHHQT